MILRSKSIGKVKSLLSGVALLPSTGEWAYSVTPTRFVSEFGVSRLENTQWDRGESGKTNFTVAIDNLQKNLPRVKWVSLVTSWFGDDLRIGECTIKPKGEHFNFFTPGGAGGVIELDQDIGAWNVGANNVATSTLYVLDQSTVYMNRIRDGSTDVEVTYSWSTTGATSTSIQIALQFYSDNAGTLSISTVDYGLVNSSALTGVYTGGPTPVPTDCRSIRITVTRNTNGSFNDIASDRQLDLQVSVVPPGLSTDQSDSDPFPFIVNGLARNEMGVPSIIWEGPTQYNPIYTQWINGRSGAAVTTQYDTSADPDSSIGQPYVDPGAFADQDAGTVLINYGPTTAGQEAYSSFNHADTGTGGPGGNIPWGRFRWRGFVWSPVARYFYPAVRKGGPGNDWLVPPSPKWVGAKQWTEINLDFSADYTFSYVEVVLDKQDTDQPWFYCTNVDMYYLETPKVSYGGTPSDRSIIEAIRDLRARGLKVMFYPFILMDITGDQALQDPDESGPQGAYPWRGRIRPMASEQGTSVVTAQVDHFFGECVPENFKIDAENVTVEYLGPEEWGLRRFTLHYAHLCALAGGVDAFCIATEMVGMTEARDGDHSFPAVEKLRQLAAEVKLILGQDCEITYACDWSEFMPRNYETSGGFNSVFHLDPLWTDPNIDFVGIDNYLPLSDWRGSPSAIDDALWPSIYDQSYLKGQIEGGERYDYMYLNDFDRDNQLRTPITEWRYRDKDHKSWWRERHFNIIDGATQSSDTGYVPELKRIVYTEFGSAAIDKGTNQPNKFLDPKSAESTVPYYSTGLRDDRMQQVYYQAMTSYWSASSGSNPVSSRTGENMVDPGMMFAWTWDARPWPAFPRLIDAWADGENYSAGHWLQGRQWIETT